MAVGKATQEAEAGLHSAQLALHAARTQEHFIAENLEWCSKQFHSNRARFVRPTDSGGWLVYTLQNGALSTHAADYAEAAMAHTVGLGRHPLLVSRPRISRVGATDLRPISVSSYLGIPLICQDRLAGVIECSGEARSDIEVALHAAMPRLERVGARLLYDPALHGLPAVDPDTICVLSSAIWTAGGVTLTGAELTFLAAIDGASTISAVATSVGLDTEAALTTAQTLIESGLLAVAIL